MTVRAITGPVTADRVSDLEATVLALSAKLAEARGELYETGRALQATTRLILQESEAHRRTALTLMRLSDHVQNHSTTAFVLCAYCAPTTETSGGHDHEH